MPDNINVLFIDCHDLGDWLGCCGRDYLNTPHLDQLAGEGLRFDQVFSTAPICMPSRASLYTGLYPHEAGCMGQMACDADVPMMGQIFQAAGYRTVNCGRNIMELPTRSGYERSADFGPSDPDAAKFLDDLACERTAQPFFAHFSFHDVHRYFGNAYDPALVDRIPLPEGFYDHDTSRKDLATFCRAVERLDERVGRLLEVLRRRRLADKTLVVFTTEHGAAILRAKHTIYDAGCRTTLIMRLPGVIQPADVWTSMVSTIDLLPTIYQLAGIEPATPLSGRSLCPLSAPDRDDALRDCIFFENTWGRVGMADRHDGAGEVYVPKRAARTSQYKLIRNFNDVPNTIDSAWLERFRGVGDCLRQIETRYGKAVPAYELFDVAEDPGEQRNLADDPGHADALATMTARLQTHLEQTDDPVLRGFVPHRAGCAPDSMWIRAADGNYRLDPACPLPDLNLGERPFTAVDG